MVVNTVVRTLTRKGVGKAMKAAKSSGGKKGKAAGRKVDSAKGKQGTR